MTNQMPDELFMTMKNFLSNDPRVMGHSGEYPSLISHGLRSQWRVSKFDQPWVNDDECTLYIKVTVASSYLNNIVISTYCYPSLMQI